MVNVRKGRCSHDSCTRQPNFNVAGSKKAMYCREHAENDMVDVSSKRCSNNSCTMFPRWGVLSDSSASVCARHKSDLQGGPVINFAARWKVSACRNVSRWELDGKPPTHCFDHGRLKYGLARTVGEGRGKNIYRSSSYGAVLGASLRVKTEVMF
ncbi:unnamed protein product [Laminaria digitata]